MAEPKAAAHPGRITARPLPKPAGSGKRGLEHRKGARAASIYVPATYDPAKPAPLIVVMHGAGGIGSRTINLLVTHADRIGAIIVAPSSIGSTWDAIGGEPGPDVERINALLTEIFANYSIDPRHIALAGFSDGASYALTLGVINGDLFTHIIAFSPGYIGRAVATGFPRIFISHGTRDDVLPIDRCSRRIVPLLRARFEVDYREFNGGHTAPADIVTGAMDWFLAAPH
ncbi:MAG: phospholipase [Acidobacteriota bacterium]|nr:phospholipase [Acidobacteriota bacterium]